MPELKVGTSNIVFPMRFGDPKFINFASGATSQDLSLKPGETIFLKILKGTGPDWKEVSSGNDWPKPKRFVLKFQEIR